MTEVTRVPLQPVGKGAVAKLWIGVAAAALLGAGVAWAALPQGVEIEVLEAGTGASPNEGDVAFLRYVGKLDDGTEFDRSRDVPLPIDGLFPAGTPFPLEEGATIPGFGEALRQMRKGGRYVVEIPADKAYGADGQTNPQTGEEVIPPNSDLVFEVELVDFMSQEDFQRRLGVLQQMMAQQMQQQGEGGAPPPAPPAQ